MKLFLMTDLEGVAGVMNVDDWLYSKSRYYNHGMKMLTSEVNAAINGFYNGGFKEIIVVDGHGDGAIDSNFLDSRAKLSCKWPEQCGPGTYWPFGLNESYSAIAFIGQHAKSGTAFSHLTHTGSFNFLDVSINGISIGEFGMLALAAGEYNIPVIFVSGEKALDSEVKNLTPSAHTAYVKEGLTDGNGNELDAEHYKHFHEDATHLSSKEAFELIKESSEAAAKDFLSNPKKFVPLKIKPPYSLICKMRKTANKNAFDFNIKNGDSVSLLLNKMVNAINRNS